MKVAFLLPLALCGAPAFAARDVLSPLPPGAVKLTGGLKADEAYLEFARELRT